MRAIVAVLVACFFLTGCGEARVQYKTEQIKVTIPTKRECPAEVCRPFKPSCPLPVFKPGAGNEVTLDPVGQADLRCLIVDMKGWGNGMKAFQDLP